MIMQSFNRHWKEQLKHGPQWWAVWFRFVFYGIRYFNVPVISVVHRPWFQLHIMVASAWHKSWQVFYFTPLFKSRLNKAPKHLQLYSGMPQVLGGLSMDIGEHCRVSGVSSFFGRAASVTQVVCTVGDNVDIGWQTTIAVGSKVIIEDNVRIAGRCYLAGFPGHPEDPIARAKGMPEIDSQVGDIVLHENVWLASGVTVLAGVTIGRNTIVGAGSVVTRNLPSNVVAGGVPAKVLRPINLESDRGAL